MRLPPPTGPQGLPFYLVSILVLMAFLPACLEAEARPWALSPPGFGFEAGALVGLEAPLRGGRVALGLDFRDIPFLQTLRLALVGDAGLSTWLFESSLGLGLGGDASLVVGLVEPLGAVRIAGESGRRLRLAPLALPSLLGIETKVAKRGLSKRLEIAVVAAIEWRVWDIVSVEKGGSESDSPPGYASEDALRAFAAGFAATCAVKLELRPWL